MRVRTLEEIYEAAYQTLCDMEPEFGKRLLPVDEIEEMGVEPVISLARKVHEERLNGN